MPEDLPQGPPKSTQKTHPTPIQKTSLRENSADQRLRRGYLPFLRTRKERFFLTSSGIERISLTSASVFSPETGVMTSFDFFASARNPGSFSVSASPLRKIAR